MPIQQIISTFLVAFVLSGCAVRAPITMAPQGTTAAHLVDLYIGTNRLNFEAEPERGRSSKTRHLKYIVRIPPNHNPGRLSLPKGRAEPDNDYLALSKIEFASEKDFTLGIEQSLRHLPPEDRGIVVYVHGFNTTFAEGAMRLAQLDHDLDLPGVSAHFSWPSASSPLGYAYDRDSTLYSRDALEGFLRALPTSNDRILLIAHSMGAQLTMESLRQIEIGTPGWSNRNLSGVILVSPDIDLEVFRQQVARIGQLPDPFVIFVSEHDRALTLAAGIAGGQNRLGNVIDPAEVADLEVTLMDVSAFSSGFGHFTAGNSPALIQILRQLTRFDTSFRNERSGRTGLVPGTVLTVRSVTDIILSPLTAVSGQ